MMRTNRRSGALANRIADHTAATLLAGLLVATLFGNAMLWRWRSAARRTS